MGCVYSIDSHVNTTAGGVWEVPTLQVCHITFLSDPSIGKLLHNKGTSIVNVVFHELCIVKEGSSIFVHFM